MLRVVLDTNIVVSALLFTTGRLAWLRRAWQSKRLQPLVCSETVNELLRVLAYPKFRLSPSERQELLSDFLLYTEAVILPMPWPVMPACRDDKDDVFLVLAHVGQADLLISGDADILALRGIFPGRIMTADEFALQIGG
jgi:putative PIN family toxin of toxin-antitoxin system